MVGRVHAMSTLTIVMYLYIRDLAHSATPGSRADHRGVRGAARLRQQALRGVLDARRVVDAVHGRRALPDHACALTFDDGFLDHFTVVFPRLVARRLTASFYPPVTAIAQQTVLETHQIHLILAVAGERRDRAGPASARGDRRAPATPTAPGRYALRDHAVASRFDGPEVTFVKRVLQKGLPPRVRGEIIRRLFDEYVGIDPRVVARRALHGPRAAPLHGAARHGGRRPRRRARLAGHALPRGAGAGDRAHGGFSGRGVRRAPSRLGDVLPVSARIDATTLDVVGAAGCVVGLTTRVGVARDLAQPLTLPRLDTNDLPRRGDASPAALEAQRWLRSCS